MGSVRYEIHVLRIGELNHLAHVALPFHGSPDMRMRCEPDAKGDGLPADFIEGVGEYLELIVAWSSFGTAAHVGLPMIAATGGEKVVGKIHHSDDKVGVDLRVYAGIRARLVDKPVWR